MARSLKDMLRDELLSLSNNRGELRPEAMYYTFVVHPESTPEIVIDNARNVLSVVRSTEDLSVVKSRLSSEFLSHFKERYTGQERDRLLEMWRNAETQDERCLIEEEMGWTFDNWIYWLDDERRHWFWHSAEVVEGMINFVAEIRSWPLPWGALKQLFLASGAVAVTS